MIERSIRLEEAMYEELKDIADAENLPVSYLVRVALARLVDDYADGVKFVELPRSVDSRRWR